MRFTFRSGLVSRAARISLALCFVLGMSTLKAQQEGEEPPEGTSQLCCEKNVVENGHFEFGMDPGSNSNFSGCPPTMPYPYSWCPIYSPQYKGSLGFNQTYGVVAGRGVQMWGITTWTQAHGEAIWQELYLQQGATYALRFDAHFLDVGNLGPDSVIFRFRAYQSQPTTVNPPGGALIGEVHVSDVNYNTYYVPAWTCPADFNYLLVSIHNTTPSDQNGSYNGWGRLDNICLQEVQPYKSAKAKQLNPETLPELYPNPTDGHVSVDYPESYGKVKSVTITDVNGREWPASQLRSNVGQLDFDAATLADGAYFIRVEFDQSEYPYTAQFRKF